MTDEIRRRAVAVIGGGRFGLMHLRCISQLERDGRARLVALADINEQTLAERRGTFGVKGYGDYAAMLRDEAIDAVGIVTPDHLHRRITLDCIAAGKHVLVEKPLDVTVEGCREIAAAAQRAGVLLQVDFHKRYDPYHLEIKGMIDGGRCGKLEDGYAYMEDRVEVPRDWFPGVGVIEFARAVLGVHMYDLLRWLVSSRAVSVYATGVKVKLASMGLDTFDSIQAKVAFASGCHVSFDLSWILPDAFEAIVNQGFRLVGSEGIVECDLQDRGTSTCFAGEGMTSHNLGFFKEGRDPDGRTRYSGYGIESIAHFVDNVAFLLGGGKLAVLVGTYASGDDGIEATRIAQAVHRSMAEGRVITDL